MGGTFLQGRWCLAWRLGGRVTEHKGKAPAQREEHGEGREAPHHQPGDVVQHQEVPQHGTGGAAWEKKPFVCEKYCVSL
jgi:hypothetical protein